MIRQLENYRNGACDKFTELKQSLSHAKNARINGLKSDELVAINQTIKLSNELEQMFESAGHYYQALVTMWIHENRNYTIMGVEVNDGKCDFDIEIADKHDERYCVEVWQGHSIHNYASQEMACNVMFHNGIHNYPGSRSDGFSNIITKRGSANMDSKYDLPKVQKKLSQLPGDRVGFLIACRDNRNFTAMMCGTDFPTVSPESMPCNKCIIVLIFSGSMDFGKRGTAFIIHHPNFEHTKTARNIIQSLGFEYDQDVYTRRYLC
ncbi:MAG: hypothetical protein OXC46_02780 [Thaumarchaeota archaeon]|nr:hypothetical protein [Nitrososphaerota archaeon]